MKVKKILIMIIPIIFILTFLFFSSNNRAKNNLNYKGIERYSKITDESLKARLTELEDIVKKKKDNGEEVSVALLSEINSIKQILSK